MRIISPTHLVLCNRAVTSLSREQAEAYGFEGDGTHTFYYLDEAYTEATVTTICDPFNGTKGAKNNFVTHYKLPESVYAFNDAWTPLLTGAPNTHYFRESFSYDGAVMLSNGIVQGLAVMVRHIDEHTVIVGTATPARGVRSSYWTVGGLQYYCYRFEEPTYSSRYGWTIGKFGTIYDRNTSSARFTWTGEPSCVSGSIALNLLFERCPDISAFAVTTALRGFRGDVKPIEVCVTDLFGEIERAKRGRDIPWRRPIDHDELVSRAFLDACDGITTLNQNSTAVLIEAASFVGQLLQGKLRFPSSASDAWLWYRYSYGTSKMDYEDYTKWVRQRASHYMERLGKDFRYKVYGMSSINVNGTDVTCRCVLKCKERNASNTKAILHLLTETGLDFNLADLWDLVPFSFIVDWLFPVGDVMQAEHDAKYFTEEYWDFEEIVFSTKYFVIDPVLGDMGSRYDRWVQKSPPKVDSSYWFSPEPSSGKTTCKRILDSCALISNIRNAL